MPYIACHTCHLPFISSLLNSNLHFLKWCSFFFPVQSGFVSRILNSFLPYTVASYFRRWHCCLLTRELQPESHPILLLPRLHLFQWLPLSPCHGCSPRPLPLLAWGPPSCSAWILTLLPPIHTLLLLCRTHFFSSTCRKNFLEMPVCFFIPSTPVCPSLVCLAAVRTPHHIGISALPHSHVEKPLANDEDSYKLHRAKTEAWGTWKRCRYCGWKPPVPLLEWGVNRDSLRFSFHWVCDATHSWAIRYSHCLVGYCFYVPGSLHRLRFLLLCNKCPQTEQLTTIIISLSLVILWVDCAQLCSHSASCDVSGGCIWGPDLAGHPRRLPYMAGHWGWLCWELCRGCWSEGLCSLLGGLSGRFGLLTTWHLSSKRDHSKRQK